jgi:hypothetical protein
LWVALLAGAFGLLVGSCFGAAASASARPRLVASWPGTGFVGYPLEIHGRMTGWPRSAKVELLGRDGRHWRSFGGALSGGPGAFFVSSHRAGRVGDIQLRMDVHDGSRVLARRVSTATVHIRPLPIVIPADRVQSLPQENVDNTPLLFSPADSPSPEASAGKRWSGAGAPAPRVSATHVGGWQRPGGAGRAHD